MEISCELLISVSVELKLDVFVSDELKLDEFVSEELKLDVFVSDELKLDVFVSEELKLEKWSLSSHGNCLYEEFALSSQTTGYFTSKNTLSMSGFVIVDSFDTRQLFELINGTKWFNLFSLVSFDKVQNKNTVFPLSTFSHGSM